MATVCITHMCLNFSNIHNDVNWVNSPGSSSSEGLGVNPMFNLNGDSTNHNDIITISSDSDTDDPTVDTSLDPSIHPVRNLLSYSSTIPLNGGKQLLLLYDCETTGLSHYVEHIIEIASVVIVPDNSTITQTEFSSLCYTPRHISPLSKCIAIQTMFYMLYVIQLLSQLVSLIRC